MTNTVETTGAYTVISILFFVLFVGIFCRLMGWTDPSAPSKPCCSKRSNSLDDQLEAQREQRVAIEREMNRKRELEEFKQRHKQTMLVKKESASRLQSLQNSATAESLHLNGLKKAALPAGSSKGFRPPSRRFSENLQKFSKGLQSPPVKETPNRISGAIHRGASSYAVRPKVVYSPVNERRHIISGAITRGTSSFANKEKDDSPLKKTHYKISSAIHRGTSSFGDPPSFEQQPLKVRGITHCSSGVVGLTSLRKEEQALASNLPVVTLNKVSFAIHRGTSSFGDPPTFEQQPLKIRGITHRSSGVVGLTSLRQQEQASALGLPVVNPMGTSF